MENRAPARRCVEKLLQQVEKSTGGNLRFLEAVCPIVAEGNRLVGWRRAYAGSQGIPEPREAKVGGRARARAARRAGSRRSRGGGGGRLDVVDAAGFFFVPVDEGAVADVGAAGSGVVAGEVPIAGFRGDGGVEVFDGLEDDD